VKKNQTVWWSVAFTNDITDGINPTIKYISKYADKKLFLVYTEGIKEGIIVRYKKANCTVKWYFYRQSYWWNNFLVMPSVKFNLWPGDQPSSPPLSFLLLHYVFFSVTNIYPLPSNLNTIQSPTTNLITIILSLLTYMFWFRFY
jgi:hypothetical protein